MSNTTKVLAAPRKPVKSADEIVLEKDELLQKQWATSRAVQQLLMEMLNDAAAQCDRLIAAVKHHAEHRAARMALDQGLGPEEQERLERILAEQAGLHEGDLQSVDFSDLLPRVEAVATRAREED